MPGPRPKPTYLKLLAGNPGHRPLPENEPEPDGDLLDPPAYLNARAQAIWRDHIANAPKGLLKKLDTNALERFCVAKERWENAYERVCEAGSIISVGQRGQFAHNPFLSVMNQQSQRMREASDELGFSPAARTRVQVKTKKKTTGKFAGLKPLKL
jgi:P27 family predicted phage terminase small subunit